MPCSTMEHQPHHAPLWNINHAMPCQSTRPLRHAMYTTHATSTMPKPSPCNIHVNQCLFPLQLDTIALSPALYRERGQARTLKLSSPTKRSHALSSSHSCSHSPPRHCQHRYASPEHTSRDSNVQGRCNRHTTGGKGKGRNANPSFFQGGTVGHGTSACAICLGATSTSMPNVPIP